MNSTYEVVCRSLQEGLTATEEFLTANNDNLEDINLILQNQRCIMNALFLLILDRAKKEYVP